MKTENMYQWAEYPIECAARAIELQKAGSCNFFMHSDDFPVQGCSCCDLYEPVADTKLNYSIFQTCVDDGADTTTFKKCFNDVNLYQHNALRKTHGANPLTVDKALAEGAAKRAAVLQSQGSLTADTTWLTKDGKLCGESMVRFDAQTAPGLTATNW